MYEDLRKEYFLQGTKDNETACLLVHGFTGAPSELRELGESLNKEGYTVSGVRLKGHGTKVSDMLDNTYMDWVNSALDEYKKLKKNYKKVYIAGHSMGSLIALYIAEIYHVDKLAILSPPLITINKTSRFAFIAKYFIKYSSWESREFTKEQKKYILGYNQVPIKSVAELNKLTVLVKKNLKKINSPMIILHSNKDNIVDGRSVDLLKQKVSSENIKCVYLKESGHLIAIEGEKDITISEVIQFFNKNTL